jgi:hypothetical protein
MPKKYVIARAFSNLKPPFTLRLASRESAERALDERHKDEPVYVYKILHGNLHQCITKDDL